MKFVAKIYTQYMRMNFMNNIYLRTAEVTDNEIIADLGATTFHESYAAQNTAEDLAMYIQTNYKPEKVKSELESPYNYYFIAFDNELAVGFAKLRTNAFLAELKDTKHIEIQQIYVRKSHQKQKVGVALMQKCIDTAISLEMDVIWLGVWEKNENALRFYEKSGFSRFGSHKFILGNDVQNDYLLSKSVEKNAV